MRIVHVLKHAQTGNGHVHVAVDLACAQARDGHKVAFVSSQNHFADVLRRHGVEVVDAAEPVGVVSALRNIAQLAVVARGLRPQVLHAHMMSSAVTGYVIAKIVGAKLVTTVHNSFEAHSDLMRLGTVVVAVSEAERRKLVGRGFDSDSTVTVINGALGSPRRRRPVEHIGDLHRPSIVTVSGLHPRKGIDVVVKAFATLHGQHPRWHLAIVGGGPGKADLEQLVAELHLGGSVHLMGGTPTPEYLLEQAEIFATGSLADPCPLAVTEARGAGCAIVGTDVDGIPELLDDGRAGILVPPRDAPAMARALDRLMSDPAALERARRGAALGSERFAVARVAADYQAVYERAVRTSLSHRQLLRQLRDLAAIAWRLPRL